MRRVLIGVTGLVAGCGAPEIASRASTGRSEPMCGDAAIENPFPATYDLFGSALAALDGQLAVGSEGDDPSGDADGGSVYLFAGTNLVWHRANPVLGEEGYFGVTLATLGTKLAVGATGADPGEIVRAGSVHLLQGSSGAVTVTFANPDPAPIEDFGEPLAAFDGNLLVGVYRDGADGEAAGRVYRFDSETGALLQTIANPSPDPIDLFGYALAQVGDWIAVGAIGEDPFGIENAGTVFLFDTAGNLVRTLPNPEPDAGDVFGATIAVLGTHLLVAAVSDAVEGVEYAGSVFEIDPQTGGVVRRLVSPHPGAGDQFGSAIAVVGNHVAISESEDGSGIDAGTVFLFDAASGELVLEFPNPEPDAGDLFGSAVVPLGNRRFAAAAKWDSVDEAFYAGTVYLLSANLDPVAENAATTVERNAQVAIDLAASDPNGDALTYEIVEAPAFGTLAGSAPHLTYTPGGGFTGKDELRFRVDDGCAVSEPATVAIRVIDDGGDGGSGGGCGCSLGSPRPGRGSAITGAALLLAVAGRRRRNG